MRIAAISDIHGHLPLIPPCDLLIIAGDICPDGVDRRLAADSPEIQRHWFDAKVRPWLAASPAPHVVATWGNHDWGGEGYDASVSEGGTGAVRLQILIDAQATIVASGQSLAVWATPWSNRFGFWAFMKEPEELAHIYARIPAGIDVLVSHQPPFGYGDVIDESTGHIGSRELLAAIERVRPRAVICGHIHEGHGRYEHNGIPIYNVAIDNEYYRPTHAPTVIEL
jgi:Icc-related predicted phosphoesterase